MKKIAFLAVLFSLCVFIAPVYAQAPEREKYLNSGVQEWLYESEYNGKKEIRYFPEYGEVKRIRPSSNPVAWWSVVGVTSAVALAIAIKRKSKDAITVAVLFAIALSMMASWGINGGIKPEGKTVLSGGKYRYSDTERGKELREQLRIDKKEGLQLPH